MHIYSQIYACRHRDVSKIWLIFLHLSVLLVFFFNDRNTPEISIALETFLSNKWCSELKHPTYSVAYSVHCLSPNECHSKSQKGWTNQMPFIEAAALKHEFVCFWHYHLWFWRTWSFTEELTDQGSFQLSCRTQYWREVHLVLFSDRGKIAKERH